MGSRNKYDYDDREGTHGMTDKESYERGIKDAFDHIKYYIANHYGSNKCIDYANDIANDIAESLLEEKAEDLHSEWKSMQKMYRQGVQDGAAICVRAWLSKQ